MEAKSIPLSDLLLDPNNYRLQEQEGFAPYPEDRFHIDRVQEATRRRLKDENLTPLRNSIIANGFLEIERIVVTKYANSDNKYLVVEGNRRVAALLAIRDEYDAGVDIPSKVTAVFDAVPCLVIEGSENETAYFRQAIMGVRHVGGIREWGGYQRAKLIADLKDNHQLDAGAISDRIGLSAIEVNRRYRAYKALQQMQESEDFSEYAAPSLYPIFHEAVSLPILRDWLGWNQDDTKFENTENTEHFYQLITPRRLDGGDEKPPKVATYSDVRALRNVIPNKAALSELLQLDRELVDALTVANREKMTGRWKSEVTEATTAMANIPWQEVVEFEDDDVAMIQELIRTADQVIALRNKSKE